MFRAVDSSLVRKVLKTIPAWDSEGDEGRHSQAFRVADYCQLVRYCIFHLSGEILQYDALRNGVD